MAGAERLRVAIAGVGPKGLYCFERLAAHATESGRPLRVDLFEPSGEPGAGAVYGSGQPEWLRMNFADRQIDAWPAEGPVAVPARRLESFSEWLGHAGRQRSGGDGYSPRALVGRYLADCFAAVHASLPRNVEAHVHRARVERIERSGEAWRLHARGPAPAVLDCDELILALGHRSGPGTAPWDLGLRGVRVSYPLGDVLSEETVPPGAPVFVRGMALTLIDVALALTEGRGGGFVPRGDGSGRLAYVPAPGEAGTITSISRSGRPVLVKPDPGRLEDEPSAAAIVAAARERLLARERFDRAADVVPDLCATAAELHAEMLAPATGERRDVMPGPARLACWLDRLLMPSPAPENGTAARRLSRSWRIAAGMHRPDVRWALGEAWRSLYPAVVERGGHGGIAPDAWPRFALLAREMERIAFGPPPLNGAKLLALVEAGKVRFGRIDELGDAPAQAARVDAVLGAPGAVERSGDVVDGLLDAGAIRLAPGGRRGIEVERDASCVGRDGSVSPGLAAVGRLTEDWVIGNDTLARRLHPHPDRWARRVASA
jgi:uncharacterized NAD(P)/FAD-binding protein YdhS